jgi:hypothetical protein
LLLPGGGGGQQETSEAEQQQVKQHYDFMFWRPHPIYFALSHRKLNKYTSFIHSVSQAGSAAGSAGGRNRKQE